MDTEEGNDLGTLAAALNAPLLAAGPDRAAWKQARPVYHLAISAADTDRTFYGRGVGAGGRGVRAPDRAGAARQCPRQ